MAPEIRIHLKYDYLEIKVLIYIIIRNKQRLLSKSAKIACFFQGIYRIIQIFVPLSSRSNFRVSTLTIRLSE